ncbi:MAG: putative cobalt transporter CbtA [Planctomycetota bacterium]
MGKKRAEFWSWANFASDNALNPLIQLPPSIPAYAVAYLKGVRHEQEL